mmetsp:Transcript_31828/g.42434  ORF Transcript_31828/g.42434 Transcript_31828/m.42434 type:complete len:88 (-) Transcript_31828:3960-4223(-)
MVRPLHSASNSGVGQFDWLHADALAVGNVFCRLVWNVDHFRDERCSILGLMECESWNHAASAKPFCLTVASMNSLLFFNPYITCSSV